jgi:hypothetical protein
MSYLEYYKNRVELQESLYNSIISLEDSYYKNSEVRLVLALFNLFYGVGPWRPDLLIWVISASIIWFYSSSFPQYIQLSYNLSLTGTPPHSMRRTRQ